MITDLENLENRYLVFIETIVTSKSVYMLKDGDNFCSFSSTQYDDVEVVPFFATEALANQAKVDDWINFETLEITITEFLEKWLVGLFTQDLIVAGIWAAPMTGKEFEPLELAIELITYMKEHHHTVQLTKYQDLDDMLNQLFEALK